MSNTVKKLEVTCNPINESNTFSSGDDVSGQIALEVVKECEIETLSIKFKGKAEVLWSERHGQTTVVYHSKDKYFSAKHFIIQDKTQDNSVVGPGYHVYPFSFKIPDKEMPSSFKGSVGKIVYLVEARLTRSMRMSKTHTVKLNFVCKINPETIPEIMDTQHESKDKKLKFFNSGTVAMDVKLEKTGFYQGEGIKVVAFIENKSGRAIKPKYCVYRKHSFFACEKRKLDTRDLFKEVGEPIPPSTSTNVTRIINIPLDLEPSIHNCSNIKVEYRLRVYLDVKYASDPVIKFPIIILAAPEDSAPPAAAGFGFGPVASPYPQPFAAVAPPQPAAEYQFPNAPPPYSSYGMYPPVNEFGSKS
ncbi:unnamed protein product [Ophioblennius macclurei]